MLAHILPNFPLAWARITSTRSTIIYFILALTHCIVQVVFQTMAFKINDSADFILRSTIEAADLANSYAQLEPNGPLRLCTGVDPGTDLDNCPIVWTGLGADNGGGDGGDGSGGVDAGILPADPNYANPYSSSLPLSPTSTPSSTLSPTPSLSDSLTPTPTPTPDVEQPEPEDPEDEPEPVDDNDDDAEPVSASPTSSRRRVTVTVTAVAAPTETPDVRRRRSNTSSTSARRSLSKRDVAFNRELSPDGIVTGVEITGLPDQAGPVVAPLQCVQVIIWPRQLLRQAKRQDVVFIAFQIWTLGISLIALFNESIPHVITALLTHLANTAWSAGQLYDTKYFQSEFGRVAVNGACNGLNLLPEFWQPRTMTEIVILVMDAVTLFLFAFLTWRLVKQFGWQTFKRVGASIVINRCYKIVLALSILLQLAFFALVAAMGLWLDLIYASVIGAAATNAEVYKGLYITMLFVLVPWICLGWFAPRREHVLAMIAFLLISGLFLGGWGAMFASTTFFHTFKDWTFFAIVTLLAAFLTLLSAGLGVACLFNFGKGLLKYLQAREPLDDGPPSPGEKVADLEGGNSPRYPFPAVPGHVPQFEVTFGGSTEGGHSDESSEESEKRDHVRNLSYSTSSGSHSQSHYNSGAPSRKKSASSRRQASGGVSISSNGATSTKRWIIE